MCGCCMAFLTCMCAWAFWGGHRQLAHAFVCCGVYCDAAMQFAPMFYTGVLLRQQKGCQASTLTRHLYDWSHTSCVHANAWQHLNDGTTCVQVYQSAALRMTGCWILRLIAEPPQHQLHNPGLKVNPQRRRSREKVQSKKQRYEPCRPIFCTAFLIDVTPNLLL